MLYLSLSAGGKESAEFHEIATIASREPTYLPTPPVLSQFSSAMLLPR
jgi:hypothetical protein